MPRAETIVTNPIEELLVLGDQGQSFSKAAVSPAYRAKVR